MPLAGLPHPRGRQAGPELRPGGAGSGQVLALDAKAKVRESAGPGYSTLDTASAAQGPWREAFGG